MAILITHGVVRLYPVFDEYWNSFGSVASVFASRYLAGLRTHSLIDSLYSHFSSYAPRVFQFTGLIIFGYTIFRATGVIFSRVFTFLSSI